MSRIWCTSRDERLPRDLAEYHDTQALQGESHKLYLVFLTAISEAIAIEIANVNDVRTDAEVCEMFEADASDVVASIRAKFPAIFERELSNNSTFDYRLIRQVADQLQKDA